MTDAEKYATIFRAAADRVHKNVCYHIGGGMVDSRASVMFCAYDGIASLFEKIVEAEREPHPQPPQDSYPCVCGHDIIKHGYSFGVAEAQAAYPCRVAGCSCVSFRRFDVASQ